MSIFRKFLPAEFDFFQLFDRHAALVVKAAEEFQQLVHAKTYNSHGDRIKAIELEADGLVHECDELLHKTFITPFEREDIFKLIGTMDDVIDLIDAAAECMVIYKVGEIKPSAKDMAELVLQAAKSVQQALVPLKSMKQTEAIRSKCGEIHRIENETDLVFRAALGELFEQESDAKTIIKWKDVFENLEESVDRCEDVADLLQGIVLEFD